MPNYEHKETNMSNNHYLLYAVEVREDEFSNVNLSANQTVESKRSDSNEIPIEKSNAYDTARKVLTNKLERNKNTLLNLEIEIQNFRKRIIPAQNLVRDCNDAYLRYEAAFREKEVLANELSLAIIALAVKQTATHRSVNSDNSIKPFYDAVTKAQQKMDKEIHWIDRTSLAFKENMNTCYKPYEFTEDTLNELRSALYEANTALNDTLAKYPGSKEALKNLNDTLIKLRILDDKFISAFIKIYKSLRVGQDSIFKSLNWITKLEKLSSVEDKLNLIKEHADKDPNGRSSEAVRLAKDHYENCNSKNNELLVNGVLYAFKKSFFACKTNVTGKTIFFASTLEKQIKDNVIDVKNVQDTPSRRMTRMKAELNA